MQFGVVLRNKPRLRVISGFDPQNTNSGYVSGKIPAAGLSVLSGQVVSQDNSVAVGADGQITWKKGITGNIDLPCFALTDTTDNDVIGSNVLVAIPCNLGNVTIRTSAFDFTDAGGVIATLLAGRFVYADGVTGNLKAYSVAATIDTAQWCGIITRAVYGVLSVHATGDEQNLKAFAQASDVGDKAVEIRLDWHPGAVET